jgi:hypothetical protein
MRLRRASFILVVAAAIAAAGLGGSQRVGAATTATGCAAPGTNVRQFCVDVTLTPLAPSVSTEEGRYVQVSVALRSLENQTLNHTKVVLALTDFCGAAQCTTTAPFSSATVDPASDARCGTGSTPVTCTFGTIAARGSATATLYVRTSSTAHVTLTHVNAEAFVDEGTNDNQNSPVQDSVNADTDLVYEADPVLVSTLAVAGKSFHLKIVSPKASELDFFVPAGTSAFTSQFDLIENAASTYCFDAEACFERTLHADLAAPDGTFGSGNFLTWSWTVFAPFPAGVSDKSINVVHTYDARPVTADAATNRFTADRSYVNVDGVQFSGSLPGGVSADTKYFVINANGNTFQIALSRTGKPVDLTSAATGTTLGSRIRIVGDDRMERTGCTNPSSLPNMSAVATSKTTIDIVACDAENGWMQG